MLIVSYIFRQHERKCHKIKGGMSNIVDNNDLIS